MIINKFAKKIINILDNNSESNMKYSELFNIEFVATVECSDKEPFNNYEESIVIFTPFIKDRVTIARNLIEMNNKTESELEWQKVNKLRSINDLNIENIINEYLSKDNEVKNYESIIKTSGILIYGINKNVK